jgi:hypothetical protein
MISTLARSASCAPNPLHKCDYHELSRQMNDKPIIMINNVVSPIKCEIGHCVYNASGFVSLLQNSTYKDRDCKRCDVNKKWNFATRAFDVLWYSASKQGS